MAYTVLLLDDDERFRRMVCPGLTSKGVVVVEAASGNEALRLYSESSFDLLIVDGVLPDTDGIKWITRYRASGGTLPIIFISSHWQSVDIYQVLSKELEVCQIIHKPVIPNVFAEQVFSEITREHWAPSAKEELSVEESIAISMEELSKEYLEELPAEIDKIEQAIREGKKAENPDLSLHNVRLFCHKLRGTAGSFGLQKLGDLMGDSEELIREHDEKGREINNAFWEKLESNLLESRRITEQKERNALGQTETELVHAPSRILVIDTDKVFVDFVSQVAKQRLVEVLQASTEQELVPILAGLSIDAIFIDVQLAEKSSFQLVRLIREITSDRIPLAFISASPDLDNRLLAAHLGASLYLNKPIDPDSLEDAIQRLMILSSHVRPKVLIVDDDQFFARKTAKILLGRDMETRILTQASRILETLQEFNPDILLLDMMMPYISGFDICKMLRTLPRWQDLPIIFVTAQTSLDSRIAAFACGADDYLPKPTAEEELVARVTLRVERSRLLKERSERDPVTGLLLRRSFMERFNAAVSAAKRVPQPLSLVIFDIDKFKTVNDSHGHLAGDSVLAGLGRLMMKRFRVEDLRGRWGGDEFILLLVGSDKQQSLRLMQNFIEEFSKLNFVGEKDESFQSALSAGIASFPEDSQSTYELLKIADERLYEAKEQGRNRVIAETSALSSKTK